MKQDSNTNATSRSALQVSTIGHSVVISKSHINKSTPMATDSGIGGLCAPIAKLKTFKHGSMQNFLTSIVSAPSSSRWGQNENSVVDPLFQIVTTDSRSHHLQNVGSNGKQSFIGL